MSHSNEDYGDTNCGVKVNKLKANHNQYLLPEHQLL